MEMPDDTEIAVLEMGISDFGEMHRLAKVARPDVCLITNIGVAHLENLGDRDGILRAKTEIFDFLPEDGAVFLNGDDDKLAQICEVRGVVPHRFGRGQDNEYTAKDLCSRGLDGTHCRICTPRASFPVLVPVPGEHMVTNALAGAAIGEYFGLSAEEIRAGIEAYRPIRGRFRITETARYTVVDDCYNANPVSMRASLEVLGEAKGRKVAVLGDMGELGENERELHAEVGRFAAGLGLDVLLAAGPLCSALVDEAKSDPSLLAAHFSTREELAAALPDYLRDGDTILVKASHFMQYEKIVEQLLQAGESD